MNVDFKFGSASISSNYETINISNCLIDCNTSTRHENIKIYNNFSL